MVSNVLRVDFCVGSRFESGRALSSRSPLDKLFHSATSPPSSYSPNLKLWSHLDALYTLALP